jgi:hypothetical protein
MPAREEPFPISAKRRKLAVQVLVRLLENGTAEQQLQAAALILEMDQINLQATRPSAWLGQVSQN